MTQNWFTARYRALIIAVVTAISIWAMSQIGLFSGLSGWLYDRLVKYSAESSYQPSVVLVKLPESSAPGAIEWRKVLDALSRLKAAQVLVLSPDINAQDQFDQFADTTNLVLGRYLIQDPDDPDKLHLQPWPESSRGIVHGVANLPESAQGIVRHGTAQRFADGSMQEPIAVVAARERGFETPSVAERGFLINFNQGRYSLPTLHFERLLAGDLIEELIADRSVVFGRPMMPSTPGIYTPVTSNMRPMSALEFHGFMLDSLLGKRVIKELPAWVVLLWLTAITLISVFIYQWFMIREGVWITILSLAVYMTLGWLVLWLLYYWLPVLEFVMAQSVMFLWISHEKSARMELEMRTMLAEMSSRLRKSALPPRFYDTPRHWEQLVAMVDQTLSLTRLIFLERVEADHRVKEIQALRCSLDSIDERRRDYERTPYSTAIAAGGPIRIEKTYLEKSELETEDQYLVPLIYSGEILGFWAFGVDMVKIQSRQQMESMAKDFSYQIAELLYHRRHWLNKEAEEARILSQYLSLQGGEVVHKDVHQALDLMERRLSVQQSVFDGLETATVLYDLFGRVMQINHHLEQLMADADIPAFDYTALDLMSVLTNFGREACQDLLRQVVMERRSLVVPARLAALPNQRFLLRMRALNYDETSARTAADSTPFELLGVLFELDDVSLIHRLYSHKETLIQHLSQRIGRGLDNAIQLSSEVTAEGRADTIGKVVDHIKSENRMLKEATAFLNKEIGTMSLQLFPIDGRQPILENIEEISGHVEVSDIRIVAELPDELSLVLAEPELLHDVTASVLDALIKDASEESTIHIIVEEQEEWIRYKFYNQGFGMPNDRFQEFLFEDDGITEGYTQLRNALHRVQSWGGTVEASSELGVGTNIEIKLRAFG